jgi:hypothetical protein
LRRPREKSKKLEIFCGCRFALNRLREAYAYEKRLLILICKRQAGALRAARKKEKRRTVFAGAP